MPYQRTSTAPVGQTGITTQHQRLTAGAAASIGSLCSGGAVPTMGQTTAGEIRYPTVVTMQVEAAGGANPVYYTVDGSAPTATHGFQVPIAPSQIVLPYPTQLKNSGAVSATNQQIQIFSAGAFVQAFFEFW